MKPKVIVIVGPTASGKTAVSIALAKKVNGEIVSADSMQVYREMNIGTAKPTLEEQEGIPHHLLDVVNPDEHFNVAMYQELAMKAIQDIVQRGKMPIVVGGTGLYINTLVNGICFTDMPKDEVYTKSLMEQYEREGGEALFAMLQQVDPDSAKVIDAKNVRRVIRALEIYHVTGKTKTELDRASIQEPMYDYRMFGIQWERDLLYDRINLRVDKMIEDGLIEEVQHILANHSFSSTALQGLGYKEVVSYLEGNISKEDMIEMIKKETRHYAKRQLTWFRRDDRITWLKKEDAVESILNQIG